MKKFWLKREFTLIDWSVLNIRIIFNIIENKFIYPFPINKANKRN